MCSVYIPTLNKIMHFSSAKRKNYCAFRLVVTAFPLFYFTFYFFFSAFGSLGKNCAALGYFLEEKEKMNKRQSEKGRRDRKKEARQ